MSDYVPLICFVAGLGGGILIGVLTFRYGFLLGWKTSYEIRNQQAEPVDEDKGLFPDKKEPAEFELTEEE